MSKQSPIAGPPPAQQSPIAGPPPAQQSPIADSLPAPQSPVAGRWPVRESHPATPVAAAADAAAAFGAATDEVDEAAAATLGVNRTDLRILGLVGAAGAMTAGRIAEAARLSPAATTTAIQRLVAAGHLHRDTDPADRRRATVTLTPETTAWIDRLYGPIAEAGHRLLDRYSPAELALITNFLDLGRRMQLEHAERLRTLTREP